MANQGTALMRKIGKKVAAFAVMPGDDWEGHIKYADCGAEAGKFGNKADLEDLLEHEKDHPVMWLDEGPAPAPLQEKGIREAELIAKQKEYIEFLGNTISDNAPFLDFHGQRTSNKEFQKGVKLREEIERLSSPLPLSDKK